MTVTQSSQAIWGSRLRQRVSGMPWQAYCLVLPAVSIIVILFGGGLLLAFFAKCGSVGVNH